jgi:hypothetical protein
VATKIRFVSDAFQMSATLNNSRAAAALLTGLPAEGVAEIVEASVYVLVDLNLPGGGAVADVEPGAVAYWPATSSLCIFFGAQPATPVVVIGKLDGDPNEWSKVAPDTAIRVERI